MTPDEILREWNEKNNATVKTTVTDIAHKDASAENAQLIENASKKEMENDMPNGIIANETPEQRRIRELEEEIARLRAAIPVQQNNQDATAGGGVSYFDQYVQKECKSEEEKEALREDVDSFWSRLAGYQNDENGHRAYGLAVGRVQSGKTRNYIGLMFKAIDEGYNTIIILTSKNSRLAYQTHKRVFGWLNGANGLGMNNYHELTRLSEGQNGTQGVEWIGSNNFNPKRVYIGVVLKNEAGHLSQARDWLDSLGEAVNNMRMLLVDDESDSATPNTNNAGEPYIESPADIGKYIEDIQNQDVMAQLGLHQWSDEKSSAIANWLEEMKNLSQQEIDNGRVRVVTSILHRNPTRAAFLEAVRQNEQFKNAIDINRTLNICDQDWNLYALVADCFSKRARGRFKKIVNWRVLRDLLYFVFSVQQERSRINRSICEIVGASNEYEAIFRYEKMLYVAYTATPYANMYQEGEQKNPLYPDCIKPLKSSSKYFGLQRIFGRDGSDCNMNIVRAIEDEECKGWVELVQDGEPIDDYTPELVREHNFGGEGKPDDFQEVEWKSLKKAIQWAYCSAAARRIKRIQKGVSGRDRETKDRWTTMLFNLSHLSSQENGAHRVQQQIVEKYVDYVTQPANRNAFLKECRNLWREETSAFSHEAFCSACHGYGDVSDYPSENEVVSHIENWFLGMGAKVHVIQMNSNTGDLDQSDYYNPQALEGDVLWIVCGGNAIARGLTLDGLTVSYYDRIKKSTTIDSITQMGRWFGYRPGYELLPRIWMRPDTVKEMKKICRIEESLHAELISEYADDASLRTGRDMTSVLYFGRRLSSRDANGRVDPKLSAKQTFDCVRVDGCQAAFNATNNFIATRGEPCPLQDGMTRELHGKHKLFWKDVSSAEVVKYISGLKDSYFAGGSVYDAAGLIRSIENSFENWNVVVGNPNNREGECIAVVNERIGIRNNPVNRLSDNEILLGKKHLTETAFLARMPDNVLEVGDDDYRLGNRVREIYDNASNDGAIDRSLLNPILLIDFVHSNDGCPYVQVSFYWHGHSSESYFRAVENPAAKAFMPMAVELIEQQGYISYSALKRKIVPLLQQEYGGYNAREFDSDIQELCESSNASVEILNRDDANRAVLAAGVLYSKSWVEERRTSYVYNTAMVIGLDLYKRILANRWDNYRNGMLNYSDLQENSYDDVIAFELNRNEQGAFYKRPRWLDYDCIYRDIKEIAETSPNDADRLYDDAMHGIACHGDGNEIRRNLQRAACGGHPLAKAQLCLYYHRKGCEQNKREYLERSELYCDEAIPLLRAMLERDTRVNSVMRMLEEMANRGFEEARHCLAEWRATEELENEEID